MKGREPKPEEPDDPVTDFENDEHGIREEREHEAGLTALGGPLFGGLFGKEPAGDGSYDAEHNP